MIEIKKILQDYKRAYSHKRPWIREAEQDIEFSLGKQWTDKQEKALQNKGMFPSKWNKIRPIIQLLSGIQRQNRSDIKAYPEGEEDSIIAEIATRLLKNVMKVTHGEHKVSEQFEVGAQCGESWIEPYLDYTYDLANGSMRLTRKAPFYIFVDPDSEEYDLSDAKYVIKLTPNLSKDQLKELFPGKEKEIDNMGDARLDIEKWDGKLDPGMVLQTEDYDETDKKLEGIPDEPRADLLDYYYKKLVKKFIVVDRVEGGQKVYDDRDEAEEAIATAIDDGYPAERLFLIERNMPEYWHARIVGSKVMDDDVCWCYPRFKGFPLIPFWAHRSTIPLKDREYLVQGIVRDLKDPQREVNKRKTSTLENLNKSTNSGWFGPKGSFISKDQWEKFGSKKGVVLEYDATKGTPQQIFPQPLSADHRLAEKEAEEFKEISGINADLLAMEDKTSSGRAIHLRQQQGLVMVQSIFDNLAQSKRLLGLFILSQLGEIYTVEKAMKVLGEAFIKENFTMPVVDEAGPVIDEEGNPQLEVNMEVASQTIQKVLDDSGLGIFDVAVADSPNAATIKFSNASLLLDLAKEGVPIPPDVLIDESMLDSATKEKIKRAMQEAQTPEK